MGVGLGVSGIASYAFLALSARALGPTAFAPLSVLWATLFVAGPGLFQPVEQELSRSIAGRIARGAGFAVLLRRAVTLTAGLYAVVVVIAAVMAPFIVQDLFSGERVLWFALLIGVGGYAVSHVVRGYLAATQQFGRYSVWFVADGAAKALPCLILAAAAVSGAGWYAVTLAVAAYVGAAAAGWGRWDTGAGHEPIAAWGELTRSMGHLLLSSVAVAALLNAGTVAVELLAEPSEADRAGIFLTGLVIARMPLFFYQAIQAALLPRLTAMATQGRVRDFRRDLWMMMGLLGVLTVVTMVGALIFGSWTVGLLFGAQYRALSGADMALLALASMVAMGALTLGQALVALHHQALVWWPWLAGLVVFVATTLTASEDLFIRVEVASVASSVFVLVAMAAQTLPILRRPFPEQLDPGDLIEALHEIPLDGP